MIEEEALSSEPIQEEALSRLTIKQSTTHKEKCASITCSTYTSVKRGIYLSIFGSIAERWPQISPIYQKDALKENAQKLKSILEDFGVQGEISNVYPGPVVTLYEFKPAPGVKSSRVISLADDIARSTSSVSTRISVMPGVNALGIEIPNPQKETVYMRTLLEQDQFTNPGHKLPLALGKNISGDPVIGDLGRMPHLLIAGTTGSGKSVSINTMILSLLYRLTPDECKFIMIDPKMLELSIYDGIPHLLTPVVTDPHKAVMALKWTVREMESRYQAMSKLAVRNIEGYNKKIEEAKAKGETITNRVQTGFDSETGQATYEEQEIELKALPFIVVIVDEMADLMLVAGKEIEAAVQRLAQMARAAGIHLIMATQRPSVDVITGTIKANFPTRISFHVTSRIDSRTILGEQGAEQLLGQGDMLYMKPGGRVLRVHGPFVSDREVESIVQFLRTQGDPVYEESIEQEEASGGFSIGGDGSGSGDALYDQALSIVLREQKASTSFIQRHLQIGYNRAARIIEKMEEEGVVSKPNHVGKREILLNQ
ncbi:MAG: DNA translocase FtsK [Holosporaceae bacterium]|nr:MAG: DNA translocase FtsK [Holosporaceae bacterium]